MKIYGLLGIAAKKGSVVSGSDACIRALREAGNKKGATGSPGAPGNRKTGSMAIDSASGEYAKGLMVLAGDSSANTRQTFMRLAGDRDLDILLFGARSELGRRVGKGARSVMIVTDKGLARSIRALMGSAVLENGGVKFG
jgi:ribosomal protein L7Ae-like RNA K-turn-binding protein